MASASKKPKTDHRPPPRRNVTSSDEKNDKAATPAGGLHLQAPVAQAIGSNFRVQQAKNFAIAQAQADGCTGNYRIFDSCFGNFLVPAIPTRADLAM